MWQFKRGMWSKCKMNIVLLSDSRQEPVSWRIEEEEEEFYFIPTAVQKKVNKL